MNRINSFANTISNVSPATAVKAAICVSAVLALCYVALVQGG